jgi:integrase
MPKYARLLSLDMEWLPVTDCYRSLFLKIASGQAARISESMYAGDSDYVFPSVKLGGQKPRYGSMVVEDYLRPAAIAAGVIKLQDGKAYVSDSGELVPRFGFHTFRHSLTSWMMDAGENPQIVRAMLHWKNLNMLAHYAHGFRETKLEAQARVLAAVLGQERELNGSQVQ